LLIGQRATVVDSQPQRADDSGVHIELTDHLRCLSDHAEGFLVLLPDAMDGRRVVRGTLGCPVCGRVVRIENGIADFGAGEPSDGRTVLSAEAVAALLGVSGPGGYIALAGGATTVVIDLASLLPGIALVLVNPPAGTADSLAGSVLRAGRLPLKRGSMRGVVIGRDSSETADWVTDGIGALLPGLRVVVEGDAPPAEGVELLATVEGCWVGKKLGGGMREEG
jgi:hypothetical protein